MEKKTGIYTVNGIEFESKIRACLFATSTNTEVKWDFNNALFKSYDWTKEPTMTLDELYDKRARELREKYDYIILSYSGGADSHNILMAFIRQNLHIDEIVVNSLDEANKKFTILDVNETASWNAGAEHELQTIPRLKEVENLIPRTKITILDLSNFLFNSFLDYGDASWVEERTEGLNPINVTRFNYMYFKEVRNKFDKNIKISLIFGIDKPRTYIQDNDFYILFNDRVVNLIPIADYAKDYTNSALEFFYWSPDALDLLCKQAHVIKRWVEFNKDKRHIWENVTPEKFRLIHERVLRNVLYTTWDRNWWQADKATKDWHCEFADFFINGYHDTRSHRIWKEGLDYVAKNANKYVIHTNGVADSLKIFSHSYKIGPMHSYDTI